MLIDIHAHLHVKDFDHDREEVITRALTNGVLKIVNVGFDTEGNFQALALAHKYDFIWATMGIHPHCASEWNEYIAQKIEEAVRREDRIVALGEMGLDYYKNFQPRELQKTVFRQQLQLAKKLHLPAIIHCRDAFKDCLAILDEEEITMAVLHCFTGSMDEAKEIWKRGYFTSFTGIVTYPGAAEIRRVVKSAPLDQIFLETDCPYLAPQAFRGKRNEPAFIVEIAKAVADLKKIDTAKLEEIISTNVGGFFGI